MRNNPCGGKHLCERADLSVSQNSLTTSPNKHSLPTPTPKADTTTPSPSASPASCSKSTSTTPTATNKWLLATDQVRQVLQLTRVPDHTTLYRTFAKLSQAQWQQLNDALLQHLQVNEMTVAVDTTGFRNDTASAYAVADAGGVRGARAGLQSVRRAS